MPEAEAAKAGDQVKKGYVGIHSSGFKDFLLKPELLRAIQDCGFEHPSEGGGRARPGAPVGGRHARPLESAPPPWLDVNTNTPANQPAPSIPPAVQHECIPQAILGMDVICQAKSGMGKTAVFVISVLQQLEPVDGQVSALVLCHTRELAFQASGTRRRAGWHGRLVSWKARQGRRRRGGARHQRLVPASAVAWRAPP